MNKAFIVVGLSFGDEGKGTIVDFLTRKYNSNLTVRFSGGSQCAHHVYDENGNHHMFSQFGAGSLAGARTLLGKNVLVNPLNLIQEEKKLSTLVNNPFDKLFIDENCVVITPYHRIVNKILEISRGNNRHGSCGQGVWEALKFSRENPARTLYLSDLSDINNTINKLIYIRYYFAKFLLNLKIIGDLMNNELYKVDMNCLIQEYNNFHGSGIKKLSTKQVLSLINNSINPIFEGNQGILLDGDNEKLYPHVTANSTTSRDALKLLKDCNWAGEKEVIGVTRTYVTRHGNGPLKNELNSLGELLSDENNPFNEWQGNMRFGFLDFVTLQDAIMYDGNINSLALTHIDLYQPDQFSDIEKKLGVKIKIKSFGPKSNQKELVF